MLSKRLISKGGIVNHFINGRMAAATGLRSVPLVPPTHGSPVARVVVDDTVSCERAVRNAKETFEVWKSVPLSKKIRKLSRWYHWMEMHSGMLANLVSLENGKTHSDALAEVERGMEAIQFAFSAPTQLRGHSSHLSENLRIHTRKEPLGVVVGILPFNFPVMIPCWIAPLALAAGNTVVLKASEKTPSALLAMAEGAKEAGIPYGALNVIQGDREIVDDLITSPDVKAVSFVGSSAVGTAIHRKASEHGKRTQMNMGAKNHAVVMPDANIEDATNAIVGAAFGGAGQRCMAVSVLITVGMEDSINERVKRLLVKKARELSIDNIGSIVTAEARDNMAIHLRRSETQGAQLLTGNRNVDSHFIAPFILDQVTVDMPAYREELFAPVLVCLEVGTLREAMDIINDNQYGNGTCIFTSSQCTANEFENGVNVGQVGINVPIPVPPPYYSWTSTKNSFVGSHHIYGPQAFDFYTQTKTTMTRADATMSSSPSKTAVATDLPTTGSRLDDTAGSAVGSVASEMLAKAQQ